MLLKKLEFTIGISIFLYLASVFIIIYSSGWKNGFAVGEYIAESSFPAVGLIIILTVFLYLHILIYAQLKNNSSALGNTNEKIMSKLDSIKAAEDEEIKEVVATRNILAMKLIETDNFIKNSSFPAKNQKKIKKLIH